MKKLIQTAIWLSLVSCMCYAQQPKDLRIKNLDNALDSLAKQQPKLLQSVDFSINTTSLPTFLKAIASSSKLNVSIDTALESIQVSQSFTNTSVKNVLIFLCKEYQLTLEFTGNIIAVKKYIQPYTPRKIPIAYQPLKDRFSISLANDSLAVVSKLITERTGKNIVFEVGIGAKLLTGFVKDKPFEDALEIIAIANGLQITHEKGNYYKISIVTPSAGVFNAPVTGASYQVIDTLEKLLSVDFKESSIAAIIRELGTALHVDMMTSKQMNSLGNVTISSDSIHFDTLLSHMLEDTFYAYRKEGDTYFFGERKQASVRTTVVIPLMFRAIDKMMEPMQSNRSSMSTGTDINDGSFTATTTSPFAQQRFPQTGQRLNPQNQVPFSSDTNTKGEALLSAIIPKETLDSLDIKADIEHNSFLVSGNAMQIEKFKHFLTKIDKPVPVILIEVMIIEVSKSVSVATGLDLGIGDTPTKDGGTLLSGTDITLGAETINKIIGGFNGFGSANLGRVVPNFYARLQALETNGDIKIKSTPKLSTLNGHKATLSNGVRSYYKITKTNTIGTQNPQVVEAVDYIPTDADLSISIRPIVSGDGNITLSINVLQSTFNDDRIDDQAPPGINSREFTSTIRVRDQDVIILGGLEENIDSKTGSGVPFLARIPIIKYLFSKKTRTKSDTRLSVLIKPTLIR